MGLDRDGLLSASVRSANECVTESTGDRLGNLFWTGKSYVLYGISSEDFWLCTMQDIDSVDFMGELTTLLVCVVPRFLCYDVFCALGF